MSSPHPLPEMPTLDFLDQLVPAVPPSPISTSLYRMSGAISPTEIAEVRKVVKSATRGLAQIDVLEAKLAKLREACATSRHEHRRFLLYHHSLLASARSLPTDVWREIFEWYVFVAHNDTAASPVSTSTPQPTGNMGPSVFRSASSKSNPLTLTHVCREWRRIAIHNHHLWCDVDLLVAHNFSKSLLPLLNIWLTRSGRLPLRITFKMAGPVPYNSSLDTTRANIHTALSLLASHSRRWREIDLQVAVELYRSPIFPVSVPVLERAKIATQECLSDPNGWHLIFFNDAPKLTWAEFHNFVPARNAFKSMIPLGSLTSVTLGSFADKIIRYTSAEVIDLLTSCQLLTEMKVRCAPVVVPQQGPIHHPNLTNIYIQSRAVPWLDLLTTPSLTQFEIWQVSDSDTEVLTNFIGRCPMLQTIRAGCDLTFLTRLDENSPQITKLELGFLREVHRTATNMSVMEMLSQPNCASKPLLPSLKIVTIDVQFQEPDYEPIMSLRLHAAIVALARDRLAPSEIFTPGLDTITVRFNRTAATEVTIEAFRSLKELGLAGLKLIFV